MLLWPYGLVVFALLIGLIIRFIRVSRHNTAAEVFSAVAAAMRQNLPLASALAAEAAGQTGGRQRILQDVSGWLAEGYPLSRSIMLGYPQCPRYAVATIVAGEEIHLVAGAAAGVEAHLARKVGQRQRAVPSLPGYVAAVLVICFLLASVFTVLILPKFASIFSGMGRQLPAVTRAVFNASGVLFQLLAIAAALLILVVVPTIIYFRFRPRWPDRPYLVWRIKDFVKWHLPIVHWFERDYSLLQTVSFLRLSLAAGCTVDEAISNTLKIDMNHCFRKRLHKWLHGVRQGHEVAATARRCRLGTALAWAFDDEINAGNTLAVLEALESSYESKCGYAANLARAILWPGLTILTAAVVGLIVYATFAPMPTMLDHIMQDVMP